MDHNEITMSMDAKVDLQDKRPESSFFRKWFRCQVRIEAVKCLPCFLRITFEPRDDMSCRPSSSEEYKPSNLTVSINVPGVVITLASSRTKQHSYAITWTQHRRSCCIYFGLDTELNCRRHMKWLRKSIKNLELHRQIMLEERRISRGVGDSPALGPLPLLPAYLNESHNTWSQRVSEIYEEIFEGNLQDCKDSQRLSRRCSRTSIASGIYEEMRAPFNSTNFESINEEMFSIPSTPPPLPPLPPQRKRFNTYEAEETNATAPLEAIPRSNTNPETELAKKKKYKNVLENLFHGNGLRSKRSVSVSDGSKEQIAENTVASPKPKQFFKSESTEDAIFSLEFPSPTKIKVSPIYANDDAVASKRQKKLCLIEEVLDKHRSKRNSFSSPDLSKINFVDTFDEQRIAEILSNSYSKCEELDIANSASLDETELIRTKASCDDLMAAALKNATNNLLDNHNISQKIPNNFNFSACNSSFINLIAPLSSQANKQSQKNKIIFDDLSGYCVMAPIVKKMSAIDNTPLQIKSACVGLPLESTSSGYSTGSHSSSTSSCTNSTGEPHLLKPQETQPTTTCVQEESVVYESMQAGQEFPNIDPTARKFASEFSGNLYENLLAIKAAQELEHIPLTNSSKISTSTPTDSPLVEPVTPNGTTSNAQIIEDENFYQTPRRSIISIDEKVPSYYPNTCESSVKSRRRSYSPARVHSKNMSEQKTPTSSNTEKLQGISTNTPGSTHVRNSRIGLERKENIYLTSPKSFVEQKRKSKPNASMSPDIDTNCKTLKTKKTAAHKISENVYAVTHCLKKTAGLHSNCNNNIEKKALSSSENSEVKEPKLQSELLNLGILQNIDFKFEDSEENERGHSDKEVLKMTPTTPIRTFTSPTKKSRVVQNLNTEKSTQINNETQYSPSNTPMSQSTITNNENVAVDENQLTAGIRKFTSLPRFKKFNLSPLRSRINNVLQRNHTPEL